MKVYEINIQILFLLWCVGATLAAVALLIPIYWLFAVSGAVGWITVCITTVLIFFHIKK